jgi:aminopeptidase N
VVDPARIHALRQQLQRQLAARIGAEKLGARYRALAAQATAEIDAASQANRSLKRRVLQLLALLDPVAACDRAVAQYHDAPSMTDRLAALAVLARHDATRSGEPLAHYRARYANDPLALDKWFALQAQLPGEGALARVQALEADPAFTLKNPNRARALLGTWANGNPTGFHRIDGMGYRLYADRLLALDALNPQIAARLATAFNGWQRLEPQRREAAHAALTSLATHGKLSRNLAEIVGNMLKG